MSNMTHDLLVHGTAAAKAGDKVEAERYLKWLLRLSPSEREKIEAFHWLADLSDDPVVKRNYIDDILARNPGDARARRKLAILNGELHPDDIIDPDRLVIDRKTEPVRSDPKRFTCPNCGARMVFAPDGEKLICENCGSNSMLSRSQEKSAAYGEASFTVAMATAKGHLKPINTKIVSCRGCGAEFIILPNYLSGTCPYCEANYAENEVVEKQIILPDLLIPFRLGLKEVRDALRSWFESEGFSPIPWVAVPHGFYFPVWTFDVGGQLSWTCSIRRNDRWETISDNKILSHNDILVPASKNLHEGLVSILETFDLTKLIPYDARYLANWMAETYQVPTGDASLSARARVLDIEKKRIPTQYDRPVTNINVNASSMAVDTYKFFLLPIWLTSYQLKNDKYHAAINGQNGHVIGQLPVQGLSDWISDIFNSTA